MRRNSKRKGAWHHGDLRRALIDESLLIIRKEGVGALVLRKLAQRVSVSSGAPYHHFPDREALLTAIAEEGFVRLYEVMRAERERAPLDPTQRLQALGRGYVQFAFSHVGHFRVMFRPELKVSEWQPLQQASSRAFELLRESIDECMQAGLAPQGDPMALVLTAWAAVHGIASLWVDGPLEKAPSIPDASYLTQRVSGLIARMFAASSKLVLEPNPLDGAAQTGTS